MAIQSPLLGFSLLSIRLWFMNRQCMYAHSNQTLSSPGHLARAFFHAFPSRHIDRNTVVPLTKAASSASNAVVPGSSCMPPVSNTVLCHELSTYLHARTTHAPCRALSDSRKKHMLCPCQGLNHAIKTARALTDALSVFQCFSRF